MKITSIKENRDITTNELQGYVLNNSIHIPSLDCRYKKDIEKFLNNGGVITPAFTDEERLEYFKSKLLQETQTLADFWSKEIKNYVAGKRLTPEQIERYEYKYEIALDCVTNDDYSEFELEAKIYEMETKDYVELIIQKHDDWIATIKEKTKDIEYFRLVMNKQIDAVDDIEKIPLYQYKLEYAKTNFNIDTTQEDVDYILNLEEIPEG